MRMVGMQGHGDRGAALRGARAPQPMQTVIDALETSVLDDDKSDQLFEQLMARMAAEEARRRRIGRLWRFIGTAVGVGTLIVGASALRLLWL